MEILLLLLLLYHLLLLLLLSLVIMMLLIQCYWLADPWWHEDKRTGHDLVQFSKNKHHPLQQGVPEVGIARLPPSRIVAVSSKEHNHTKVEDVAVAIFHQQKVLPQLVPFHPKILLCDWARPWKNRNITSTQMYSLKVVAIFFSVYEKCGQWIMKCETAGGSGDIIFV